MAKTFKRTAEPVTLTEALSICLLLVEFETEVSNKRTRWYKELCQIRQILAELKSYYSEGDPKMTSDMNFFRSRTKAGQQDQQAPEMPDNARAALEQLAAGLSAIKDKLAEVESRLTALESGSKVEQKSRTNGHAPRSFQQDIFNHKPKVTK